MLDSMSTAIQVRTVTEILTGNSCIGVTIEFLLLHVHQPSEHAPNFLENTPVSLHLSMHASCELTTGSP